MNPQRPDPSQAPSGQPSTSSSSSSSSMPSSSGRQPGEETPKESNFECNICLDPAKDAVVSVCGHLFCWECLHEWFQTRNPDDPFARSVPCPVCKNPIKKDKVIPLYGRGGENKDPRERNIPPRPQGQRSSEREAFNQPFFNGPGDGFHMSFGIGAFPFGFFASTFNIGGAAEIRGANVGINNANAQVLSEQIISKAFLLLGIFFIVWILLLD